MPIEKQMFQNRITLQHMKVKCKLEDEEKIYTVCVKISEADTTYGWYYTSCNTCTSKIKIIDDGTYFCDRCNMKCKFPYIKYRFFF